MQICILKVSQMRRCCRGDYSPLRQDITILESLKGSRCFDVHPVACKVKKKLQTAAS